MSAEADETRPVRNAPDHHPSGPASSDYDHSATGMPGVSYATPRVELRGRHDLTAVPDDIARRIKGPGMTLDQFLHDVRERRWAIERERGIGTQRNKDVFLKELTVIMGNLAQSFSDYRDRLRPGHEAATHWLVQLAAEASRFAEWDARAGR